MPSLIESQFLHPEVSEQIKTIYKTKVQDSFFFCQSAKKKEGGELCLENVFESCFREFYRIRVQFLNYLHFCILTNYFKDEWH